MSKVVNVNVTIQMDVMDNEETLPQVLAELDRINHTLYNNSGGFNPQIFVEGIDNSNIIEVDEDED